MKARVKATGEIVEVDLPFISVCEEIVYKRVGSIETYAQDELDFDLQEENIIDYWGKLKHQYAGMAMHSLLSNTKRTEYLSKEIAEMSDRYATALVNRLKEEQK